MGRNLTRTGLVVALGSLTSCQGHLVQRAQLGTLDATLKVPSATAHYSLLLESGDLIWLTPRAALRSGDAPPHWVQELPLAETYRAHLTAFDNRGDVLCTGSASFALVEHDKTARVTISCTEHASEARAAGDAGAPRVPHSEDAGAEATGDAGLKVDTVGQKPVLPSDGSDAQPAAGAADTFDPPTTNCPQVIALHATPSTLQVGQLANLIAEVAEWPETTQALWSGSDALVDPTALWAQVECQSPGDLKLSFAVVAPLECATHRDIVVTCLARAPATTKLEPVCGDGAVTADEACDDANTTSGDGCSALCQLELCGNRRIDANEECEPPNAGRCDATCHLRACGNGFVDPGESCDPGALDAGVDCTEDCRRIECGDGIVDAPEECEDGNIDAQDGCSEECLLEY